MVLSQPRGQILWKAARPIVERVTWNHRSAGGRKV